MIAQAPLALIQAALSADTVVTVQASATGWPHAVHVITSFAEVVIALALVAVAITTAIIAMYVRRMVRKVDGMVDTIREDSRPVLKHARDVAENVNYISTSVRSDVEEVKGTIRRTQERLNHAAALAEERIVEFNGMLEVVQEEAERLFIDTAASVHGVKAGARTLRRSRTSEPEE